jgi:GNAT superfamily N-acetyltransferase
MSTRSVTRPERLNADHEIAAFDNGRHASLNDWLVDRALVSEGASARTYVICNAERPRQVVGYYTITTAMEERSALPSAKLPKGMPGKVPLLLITRLAVASGFQGLGLGADLLADALHRCAAASEIAGVRAVIVHALDDHAVSFYTRHGFMVSPVGTHVLLMPIEAVRVLQG